MQFFVIWLLPPIIFEAAFNLNVDAFLESIVPTLLFAFVGAAKWGAVTGGLCLSVCCCSVARTCGRSESPRAEAAPAMGGRRMSVARGTGCECGMGGGGGC